MPLYEVKCYVKPKADFVTYSKPAAGRNDAVTPSKNPENTKPLADIHSHGKFE